MKKALIFTAAILVGVGVALIYHFFESIVHGSIDYIWYSLLNTDDRRWLVVPALIILSLAYFGAQHVFDLASESHESHGFGDVPKPSIINFIKVLGIGFLSLVAGASLGPEAILVPAAMIFGAYVGAKVFKDSKASKILGAAGFIALFAAFFHSFIIGLLSILLVKKKAKAKLNFELLLIAILAAGSCYLAVKALSSPTYFDFPSYSWRLSFSSLLACLVLLVAGGLVTYAINFANAGFKKVHKAINIKAWWHKSLVAAVGLSLLYLAGGPLIEFTGNKSIEPMLHQAPSLGFIGLLWILITKIGAISWSKTLGYRGGMVFPTIFLASVLVAISQVFINDINFIYGLIAALAGALIADSRVKVLI